MIRFHTQTGGVTLQAQQPEVNIIRVALQGFAAVAGGTQSLHTNGFDEALALPTERSARIALRTQQVLAHESGVADTVDPFAGSYFIESLTDEVEERSWELMEKVEDLGGSVNALEFIQQEIEESALSLPRALPHRPGHHRRRQQVRQRPGRRRRHPQGRPGVREAPAGSPREVQGGARPGRARQAPRVAPRRRPRRGQPAASDQGGAAGRRLDRRGLQRDARRLRRVPRRRFLLGSCHEREEPGHPRREARLPAGAARGGGPRRLRGGGREAAREGQAHRAGADREAARPRFLRGARHLRPPPHP